MSCSRLMAKVIFFASVFLQQMRYSRSLAYLIFEDSKMDSIDLPNASKIHREVTIGWLFHYLIS